MKMKKILTGIVFMSLFLLGSCGQKQEASVENSAKESTSKKKKNI